MTTAEQAAAPSVVGPRTVAGIIDVIILAVIFIVMSIIFGGSDTSDGGASFELSGGPALLFFLLAMGYYIAMEASVGSTIGKKVMGLRVVADNGELTLGAVVIRTLMRIVDALPFLYLVGFLTMAIRSDHKRLGDMVAGTNVVKA